MFRFIYRWLGIVSVIHSCSLDFPRKICLVFTYFESYSQPKIKWINVKRDLFIFNQHYLKNKKENSLIWLNHLFGNEIGYACTRIICFIEVPKLTFIHQTIVFVKLVITVARILQVGKIEKKMIYLNFIDFVCISLHCLLILANQDVILI